MVCVIGLRPDLHFTPARNVFLVKPSSRKVVPNVEKLEETLVAAGIAFQVSSDGPTSYSDEAESGFVSGRIVVFLLRDFW